MKKIRFKKASPKREKFTPLGPNGVDERPDFYLHRSARIRRANQS